MSQAGVLEEKSYFNNKLVQVCILKNSFSIFPLDFFNKMKMYNGNIL